MNTTTNQATRISGFCRGYFHEKEELCIVFEKCTQKELYKQEYAKEKGRGVLSRLKRVVIIRNPAKLPGFVHAFNPFVYLTIEVVQDTPPTAVQPEEKKGKKSKGNKKQKTGDESDNEEMEDVGEPDEVPPLEDSRSGDPDLEALLQEDETKKNESATNPRKRKRIVSDEESSGDGDGDEGKEKEDDVEMVDNTDQPQPQPSSYVYDKRCTQYLEEYFFCGIVDYANLCEATWTKVMNVITSGYFLHPIIYTAIKSSGDARFDAMEFLDSPVRVNRTNTGLNLSEEEKEIRGLVMDFRKPAFKSSADRKPSFMSDFSVPVEKNAVSPQEEKLSGLPFPAMFGATTAANYSSSLKAIIDVKPNQKIKDLDEDTSYFYNIKISYWKKIAEIACCGLKEPTENIRKIRFLSRYSKIGTSCICDIMKVVYPYAELFWGEARKVDQENTEKLFGLLVKYYPTSKFLRDVSECNIAGPLLEDIEKTRATCDLKRALVESTGMFNDNICSALQLFTAMGRPRFDSFVGEYIWTCVADRFVSGGLSATRSMLCSEISPYSMACQYGFKLPPNVWVPPFMRGDRPPFCKSTEIYRNTSEYKAFMAFFDLFMKTKHDPGTIPSADNFFDYANIMSNILKIHISRGRMQIENEWFDQSIPDAYFIVEPTKLNEFFIFWKKDVHSPLEMFCSDDQLAEFNEHVKKTGTLSKFFVSCSSRLRLMCSCLAILKAVGNIPHSLFDTVYPDGVEEFMDANNPKSVLETKNLSDFEYSGSNAMLVVCSKIKGATRLTEFFASNPKAKSKNLHVISFEGINASGRRTSSPRAGKIENILARAKTQTSNKPGLDALKHELYKLLTGYESISMETFLKNNQRNKLVGVDVVYSDVQDLDIDALCNSIRDTMFDSERKEIAFWVDKITFCCNSFMTSHNNRTGFHTAKVLRQWYHFQQQQPVTSGNIQIAGESTLLVTDQHHDDMVENLNMILDDELTKGIEIPKNESDDVEMQSDYDRIITSSFVVDKIKKIVTSKAKLVQGVEELTSSYVDNSKFNGIFLGLRPYTKYFQGQPPFRINEIPLTNHFHTTPEVFNSNNFLIDMDDWSSYAVYYDWMTLASLVASQGKTLTVIDKNGNVGPFGFTRELERVIARSKKCITPNIIEYLCRILYRERE